MITNFQRLLVDVIPDRVHILQNGKNVMRGDRSLALTIEPKGYSWLSENQATENQAGSLK